MRGPVFSEQDELDFHQALVGGSGQTWLGQRLLPVWGARHPVWVLLEHASHLPKADTAQALDALLKAGWDPKVLEEHPPHGASGRQRRRWYRPLRVYPSGKGPSLLARLSGLPNDAARAWSQILVAHGHRPTESDWTMAAHHAAAGVMDEWRTLGCVPPEADALFQALVHVPDELPVQRTHAACGAVLDGLMAQGWKPSAAAWNAARKEENGSVLAALLERFPEGNPPWNRHEWASALGVLLSDVHHFESTEQAVGVLTAVSRQRVVQKAWNETAVPAAHRAPGHPLSEPTPPWVSLIAAPTTHHARLWRVAAPWVTPAEWKGKTPAEWWAELGETPEHGAAYGLATGPNPRTGRWPAAGARAHCLDAWVNEGGGWGRASEAPRGPLAELAARAVRQRDRALEERLLPQLRALPADAMRRLGFDGSTLAEWCAGRPRMASAAPGAHGDAVQALKAAIQAASVAQVRQALKGQNGAGAPTLDASFIEAALTPKWGRNEAVLGRVATIVGLLHDAGAPWPDDPLLWHNSALFLGANGSGPTRRTQPFDAWVAWKDWPPFLAPHWVNSAADSLEHGLASARHRRLHPRWDTDVWDSLARAGPDAADAVLQALLDAGTVDDEERAPLINRSPESFDKALVALVVRAVAMRGERPWPQPLLDALAHWDRFVPSEDTGFTAAAWAPFWKNHPDINGLTAAIQAQAALDTNLPAADCSGAARARTRL